VPSNRFPLTLLEGTYAVCRLGPEDDVPGWAAGGPLSSVTRTPHELSVVCPASDVPAGVRAERDWRAFQLQGPVPFTTVGVISSLTRPLAEAGIPVFVLSTFDTDYLLVKEGVVSRAGKLLERAGFQVGAASAGGSAGPP
jgi:uncharacterized protein